MAWVSQVSVDTTCTVAAGWCLSEAESCVGAAHLYATAKEAADNSDLHADRDYPTDAVVALFWDWTSKSDGIDYGHVVINVPGQGLFSSPKQWGETGNAWYSSIDEVSNWLGASYIGWSPSLAGTVLSIDDGTAIPVAPTAAVTSNQRVAGANGSHRRAEPNTTSENLTPDLETSEVGNFLGWIHGENVSGNDIWYQGTSGNWFWSGSFTDSSTDGLPDLNPAVSVTPVDVPVVAPVAPIAVVTDAPAVTVDAPIVTTPKPPVTTPKPKTPRTARPAPTKEQVMTVITDSAATADETAKVSTLTLLDPAFWIYSGERIVKSAAYSANAMLVANGAGLLQADWQGIVGVAAMAAVSSLLVALSSFKDI